ncbi:hypothetical protein M408DRAFT_331227 [Serendipita vermifera MAFF 305830]|uniref:Uncharacterized protein n=1 Tax=Serendipita vermifera MAFF 305830 TaxID=933852 RepID=A0A0C3AZ77_SERVB|nr:hypothetical protein M408DRAFT_331227 [Serendipita vermifera MAFF 305830]
MLLWALNSVLTTRVYTNLVWLAHKPAAVTGMYTGASIGFSSRSYGTSGAGSTTVEMMPTLHRERIVEENGIGKGKRKSDE